MTNEIEIKITDIVRAELDELVESRLNSKNVKLDIESGSNKGDNYTGILYRVTARVADIDDSKNDQNVQSAYGNDESLHKGLKFILKVAPTDMAMRKQFYLRECFMREVLMYDKVLPMFRQFQIEKGVIPEENGFFEYPECLKTIDTDLNEALFLADLKEQNFTMFNRLNDVTVDHVQLVMTTLGKYHALSFALRDQQYEEFAQYSSLEEVVIREHDETFKEYLNYLVVQVNNALDEVKDKELIEKFNEIASKGILNVSEECVDGKLAEPYAVICHGDCWNNNILFRHDENGKPNAIRLLDWQNSRYASPACDILYYIFCCTTKELRDQYYDHFLQTYYDSLSNMLKRLGSDPTKLFPFDALKDQLKRFGKFGLLMATLVLPVATTNPDDCFDLGEICDMIEKHTETKDFDASSFRMDQKVFNKRMRDVIIDMVQLEYL